MNITTEDFAVKLFSHYVECVLDGIEKEFGVQRKIGGVVAAEKWWLEAMVAFKESGSVSFNKPCFKEEDETNKTD